MMSRVAGWFSLENPRRWWLLAALGLMLSLAGRDAVSALSDAAPGGLTVVLLAGAATAWALGNGPWSAGRAGGAYASAGVGAIAILTARVMGSLSGLFNETFFLLFEKLNGANPDLSRLGGYFFEISARMGGLLARAGQWLAGLAQGRAIEDPLVSGMAWLVAAWLLAGWVGWRLARKADVLGAFVPLLAAQAVLLDTYQSKEANLLWASLLVFVGLLGLVHLQQRLRAWLESGLDYAESAVVGSVAGALGLAALVVALAAAMPSVSVEELRRAWEESRRARAGEGAPAASGTGETAPRSERIVAGLPRNHLLSGDVALSETLVMRVRTYDLSPVPRPEAQLNPPRYYWRAYTYDSYSGQGWASSPVETASYAAGEILTAEKPEFYKRLRHDFELLQPEEEGYPVFRAGLLERLDLPMQAEWRNALTRLSLPAAPNGSADLYRAVSPSNRYQATSLVATVDVATLRDIWPDYPEWVRTRYLALPPMPQRVTELAQDITAAAPTLYDRAEAIERYLRTNYDYTLDVPAPPPGRDPVDYFLFELGRGYCDYYASAMVVLARSVGIPARLVVGYVGGTYDPVQAVYLVREADAHSWVEVYFPQVGWVEFEPTAGQAGFERASTGAAPLPYTPPEAEPDDPLSGLRRWLANLPVFLPWAAGGLLLAGLALGLYIFVRDWRDPRPPVIRRIGRVYQAMRQRGAKRLGDAPSSQTSQEFLQALRRFYETGSSPARTAEILEDAARISALYEKAVFSPRLPAKSEARQAEKAWARLRWRL